MGKMCLAMVVANERPVIERCLDSTRNMIDQICISINGDEDGTQKCIEEWGKRNGIPTVTWFDPWDGYGPNKTRNLRKIHDELETEYILFIDADEVFVTNPHDPMSYPTPADAQKLYAELDASASCDAYYMKSYYGNAIYSRWQIIRNNQIWTWHLPFQEVLVGEKSNNRYDIGWIYNYVRHEGHSSRFPDLEKNIKLLQGWVDANKDCRFYDRGLFYLGQAYKESAKTDLAIQYLTERLKHQGWMQERYIAAYYLAQIYAKGSQRPDPELRRHWLEQCNKIDPRRLEGYYYLMMDAHKTGDNAQAISWGVQAPKSRKINGEFFLADRVMYEYNFDFQLSIVAYWSALKQAGEEFDDRGILSIGIEAINRCYKSLPEPERVATDRNKKFFAQKMAEAAAAMNLPSDSASSVGLCKDYKSVIIVEDFYDDPMQVRELALNTPFEISGNYPGRRTKPHRPEGIKEKLERVIGDRIDYWPDSYNGSFQYTTADQKSWIHRDATEWSVVIFLTPDPPVDGGTKLFLHKKTGVTRTTDPEIERILNEDSYNHDAWHVLDKIGNRFNRAVFFKGLNSHMSDLYFGTNKNNGRLFQTFFFNSVSYTAGINR